MAKKKRKKKKKPDVHEIEKRNHRKEVRAVFSKQGYKRVPGVSDKQIEFEGRKGDFDDCFLLENLIVIAEYTISQADNIGKHLLQKKILFDNILRNKSKFIEYLEGRFPKFKANRDSFYDIDQCQVVIVYCSKYSINKDHKKEVDVAYLDYPIVKYFKSISSSIKYSSRFEFYDFLGLDFGSIGKKSISAATEHKVLDGTILPESHTNFKKGFKVLSFYIDPKTLLEKSYVLRKHGWRDEAGLYQRMIAPAKIKAIRKYLSEEARVFINNIIVTLPHDTKLLNNGKTIETSSLIVTKPVKIQIPDGYCIVGLIDGQHRVYAYHEGGSNDDVIAKLREKQNLLVTGIVYPENIKDDERVKFEAKLFLEINSNQTNAKSDLKQAINVILKPYTSESIARSIIYKLNRRGPLENTFEEHFYDKGKIKVTSIVSYGLKPLVKLSGNDSLFKLWSKAGKKELVKENNFPLLENYIDYCTSILTLYFGAIKFYLKDTSKWTTDAKVNNRVLSTTAINGFIICLRKLVENGKVKRSFDEYQSCFKGLDNFQFSSYKSSHYGALGEDLYSKFF